MVLLDTSSVRVMPPRSLKEFWRRCNPRSSVVIWPLPRRGWRPRSFQSLAWSKERVKFTLMWFEAQFDERVGANRSELQVPATEKTSRKTIGAPRVPQRDEMYRVAFEPAWHSQDNTHLCPIVDWS